MEPSVFKESIHRPALEARLESIISGAALIADTVSTRHERREHIVDKCNLVREALQNLLSEYIANVSIFTSFCLFYFLG